MWLQSEFLFSLVTAFEWPLGWYRPATLEVDLAWELRLCTKAGVTTLLPTYDKLPKQKGCWSHRDQDLSY